MRLSIFAFLPLESCAIHHHNKPDIVKEVKPIKRKESLIGVSNLVINFDKEAVDWIVSWDREPLAIGYKLYIKDTQGNETIRDVGDVMECSVKVPTDYLLSISAYDINTDSPKTDYLRVPLVMILTWQGLSPRGYTVWESNNLIEWTEIATTFDKEYLVYPQLEKQKFYKVTIP